MPSGAMTFGENMKTVTNRFWKHVNKEGNCWVWTGNRGSNGYGQLSVYVDGTQKKMAAHRLSYIIHCATIPAEMVVLHTCDNPACVNPKHLRIGSRSDNQRDMIRKGRWRHGVLSPEQKSFLRETKPTGRRISELANIYGVTCRAIRQIASCN